MNNNPSGTAVNFIELINKLERRNLDQILPSKKLPWGAKIETVPYFRVLGQARFWEENTDEPVGYESHLEDLVTGVHGQGFEFAYLILSSERSVEIYYGLQGTNPGSILRTSLEGTFPGIQLTKNASMKLGTLWSDSHIFDHVGRFTGIPTRKSGIQARFSTLEGQKAQGRSREGGRIQQIERLLRGMVGEKWGYLVWAVPIPVETTINTTYKYLKDLSEVSLRLHSQENLSQTKSEQIGQTTNVTEARSMIIDRTDRWASYATELLERELQRSQLGKAQGMWQTEVYFFSNHYEGLAKLSALLRAIYAGEDSTPEPVRTFVGEHRELASSADQFATALTSSELATISQLPREEFPGYRVSDYARFDVDVAQPPLDSIPIGKVLDINRPTGGWYAIPRSDLAKHALIVGVTGSGKTNSLFYLLDKLWQDGKGIPFLVIEPAKTEYRDLAGRPSFHSSLRIYTLGDERFAPFRINPFAFEIDDAFNRIHVQTHIDFMKSVFNAAFILYAPMPYVLETCLHEIYEDKGWDLTTGHNRRLPLQDRGKEYQWPVFPTLTDLYNKIDEIVDRLGYEERIERDVKAGLKARIGSLRLGGKGLMLDTRHGLQISDLLSYPTILELERVGNDDEKAFLIGLLLTRIYEYRILQAKRTTGLSQLQHVTVFEEAHRLLKNTDTEVGTEEANTKAQAVEAFSNMLSEIRAYGQGVLIAEQIPTKLASDAVKNTNLKIMHRVVAIDDREVMGKTMNLTDDQMRIITTLSTGQAAVFAEGADKPYLLQILKQPEKDQGKKRITDEEVTRRMKSICTGDIYDPVPGYCVHIHTTPENSTEVRDVAQDVIIHPEFSEQFSRYFLSMVVQPRQAVDGYNILQNFIHRTANNMPVRLEKPTITAVLLYATDSLIESRGRHYRWLYNITSDLRCQLIDPLVKIVAGFQNRAEVIKSLADQAEIDLKPFIESYLDRTNFKKHPGPFAGCIHCLHRCLYRWDLVPLLQDKTLERDFTRTIQNNKDDQVMWKQMAGVASSAASRVLSVVHEQHQLGVALCFTTQITAGLSFSASSQRKAVQNIKKVLGKKE